MTANRRVAVRLGDPTDGVDEGWLREGLVDATVGFGRATPDGYRWRSRILGIGVDSLVVAVKATLGHRNALFVATNPWIGVALRLLGRRVAVTGLYATPGSRSWRVLRRILGNSPVVTTSDIEAHAWNTDGGRAAAVTYGRDFPYPSRAVRQSKVVRVFVGGSSDRDFRLLRDVISAASSSRMSLEFCLAIGGEAYAGTHDITPTESVEILPPISQAEFGAEMACSDVVFLPLVENLRAAGQMVAVGSAQCGVPVVTSPIEGMTSYLAVPETRIAQSDPHEIAAQLMAVGIAGRSKEKEIRDYWERNLSQGAYLRAVRVALETLTAAW